MTMPDRRAWLFSAKTFAAAMLAVYVSLRIGLPRPYWAMATCYIVAQPWSGMARAKGLYRILGTLGGAIAAIALVPNLVSAPPLLVLAMALWAALCLGASLVVRAPQSYAFMLAGYTAAIIGFPSVDQPGAIFDTAMARTTEIGLGILCVLLVESIFPLPSASHVVAKLDDALRDLARLACRVMKGGNRPAAELVAERRQVARDSAALGLLVAHLRYEPPTGNGVRDWVPVLHRRIRVVPLLLAGIADRAAALCSAAPEVLDALMPLLRSISQWLERSAASPAEATEEAGLLLARIDAAARQRVSPEWPGLMRAGLLNRLRALVLAWQASLAARRGIGTTGRPSRADRQAASVWPPVNTDSALVLLSGLAVLVATLAVCAFWIATAWPSGDGAATMAVVGAAMFAQQDDPGCALNGFLWGALAAIVLAALYLFAVLPAISGFVPLTLALALLFLPAGAAQGTPALMAWGMPITVIGATLIGLTAHFTADFASFMGGAIGFVIGLAAAQVTMALLRPAGIAWRVHRLVAADRRDLARVARGAAAERADLVAVMLDRFDAVAARLTPDAMPDAGTLTELRVALNVVELHVLRPTLDHRLGLHVDRVLRRVARHVETAPDSAAGGELRAVLDTALTSAVFDHAQRVALALAGLRRALLPDAPLPALRAPTLEQAA